jgi:hypothetical protein
VDRVGEAGLRASTRPNSSSMSRPQMRSRKASGKEMYRFASTKSGSVLSMSAASLGIAESRRVSSIRRMKPCGWHRSRRLS